MRDKSSFPFPFFNPFELIDIVRKELNPFQVLMGAVEETKDNFRLEIDMRYMNELIRLQVLEESENLLDLDVYAKDGRLIVKGEYHVGQYKLARMVKASEVEFNVELLPVWVKGNQVRFRVSSSRVWNKQKRKFDVIKYVSEFFPNHRKYILKELSDLYPNQLSLTKLKYEIKLNLNYYFDKAGISLDAVKVHKVMIETNKLIFYVRSTVILKSLVDFFGSNVLSITNLPKDYAFGKK